jgi:hypothetical protein
VSCCHADSGRHLLTEIADGLTNTDDCVPVDNFAELIQRFDQLLIVDCNKTNSKLPIVIVLNDADKLWRYSATFLSALFSLPDTVDERLFKIIMS